MLSSCLRAFQSTFVILPLAVVPAILPAQQGHENASSHDHYTVASLCGNYGAIATYGANVARALGFEAMDGHGNISGSAIADQPGPNSTCTITKTGIAGTYTVNADGSGTMNLTITLPTGATANVTEDYTITMSRVVDGIPIATEIQDAQEEPSAVIDDTSLVIHTYTLRGTPKPCSAGH